MLLETEIVLQHDRPVSFDSLEQIIARVREAS